MRPVIVTAFEPFHDETVNPTQGVLAELPDFLYDVRIVKATLPVIYGHAFDVLLPLIEEHNPRLIVLLGLAKGRTHVSIERIAINAQDASIADNAGNTKRFNAIVKGGPDGLFTTIPLETVMTRLKQKHVPTVVSNTAGAYVCNDTFYRTLYHIKTNDMRTKCAFVHMPMLPEHAASKPGIPALDRKHTVDVVTTIINAVINPLVSEVRAP